MESKPHLISISKWKSRLMEARLASARGNGENNSLTALIDELLIHLGKASGWDRPGCALVALGGYGRGRLAPWSDVDLLFLTAKRSRDVDVDSVLYPLWDLDLEVGHALRTPKDCGIIAAEDLTAATAIMDSRLIIGDGELFSAARKKAGTLKPGGRAARRWIEQIGENVQNRHERFGSICSLLEPHLKEGKGGLRDLQACRWVFACQGESAEDFFRERSCAKELAEAEGFIFRARNALHVAAGRKTDHLTFEYHDETASAVMPDEPIGKFFESLHRASHKIASVWKDVAEIAKFPKNRSVFGESPSPVKLDEESISGGLLKCCNMGAVFPTWLSKWIREAAPDCASRVVLSCAGRAFASNAPLHPFLLELHRLDKLSLFSPDLAAVVHQVNYDARHAFTTGIHCMEALKTVEELLLGFHGGEESYLTGLAASLPRPGAVRLSALCHDLGKINGVAGHAEASGPMVLKLARDLGFDVMAAEFAVHLVSSHHLITGIAFGDDLENPDSWQKAMDGAKTIEALDALAVLSHADLKSVNPLEWTGVWTSWKRDLLVCLHSRARAMAEGMNSCETQSRKSSSATPDVEISQDFYEQMPVREADHVPPKLLAKLLELHKKMNDVPAAWHLDARSKGITEILGVIHSMPKVLSSITGFLAQRGFNILSVQLHSWPDGILHVWMRAAHPREGSADSDLTEGLTRSVTGEIDTRPMAGNALPNARNDALPVQTRVRFLPSESPFYTSLEVRCRDRSGLLRDLTCVFEELAVTVEHALVTTHGPMAQDVFQLKDIFGRKIDSAAKKRAILQRVEKAIEDKIK